MHKVDAHCCGLDVHKDSSAACLVHDDGRSLVEMFGVRSANHRGTDTISRCLKCSHHMGSISRSRESHEVSPR